MLTTWAFPFLCTIDDKRKLAERVFFCLGENSRQSSPTERWESKKSWVGAGGELQRNKENGRKVGALQAELSNGKMGKQEKLGWRRR